MVNYRPNLSGQSQEEKNVTVKDIMIENYESLNCESDVVDAIKLILDHKISGAVVVDDKKKPIGFLSEKDCLKLALEMKYYNGPAGKVRDHMSKFVTTLNNKADIYDAIEIFTKYYFHIVPIVDNDHRVVGIVNRHAVLKAVDKMNQTTW